MAKNSTEGNRTRTARYRAALAERGIRPVQLLAPENAHVLLRQAVGLMTQEQGPLEPRAALRQAGGANEAGDGAEEAAMRSKLADAEDRARALLAELEAAREAGRWMKQARVAGAAAALAVVRTELEAAQGREKAAQEAADAFRDELARIRGRGGWRGVLLRLAGAGARCEGPAP